MYRLAALSPRCRGRWAILPIDEGFGLQAPDQRTRLRSFPFTLIAERQGMAAGPPALAGQAIGFAHDQNSPTPGSPAAALRFVDRSCRRFMSARIFGRPTEAEIAEQAGIAQWLHRSAPLRSAGRAPARHRRLRPPRPSPGLSRPRRRAKRRCRVLDLGGRRLGIGIVPGRVAVFGAADDEAVVMRRALPRAFAGRVARPQQRLIDRRSREQRLPSRPPPCRRSRRSPGHASAPGPSRRSYNQIASPPTTMRRTKSVRRENRRRSFSAGLLQRFAGREVP